MRLAVCALVLVAGCGGAGDPVLQQAQGGSTPSTSRGAESQDASPRSSPDPRHATATAAPDPAAYPLPTPQRASASPGSSTVVSGSASSGPGRSSSPTALRPTPTRSQGTVTVTQDDNGQTVRLTVGDRLRVRLTTGTWDPPVSGEPAVVVRRSSNGGYPSDQPVDAVFEAVATGRAEVTAQSDAACFHTEPRCMMASQLWQVHVLVR